MTQTLKFFKLIRELFRKMGIQNRTYNLRNSFILIILAQMFVASAVFLLFEADSIEGYGQSFYLTATSLLLLFLWPYFIHNMDNLFHLMNQMDKFGQNRKSKKKSNPQILNEKYLNKFKLIFKEMVRFQSLCMAK